MINKFTLLYFFTLIIFSSCNSNQEADSDIDKPSEYQEIKIEFDPEKVVPTDHLIDTVLNIQLENQPDNIIGGIFKVCYTKDKLYIVDKLSNVIYVFSDKGKLLSKINKNGSEAGEYRNIADIQIDRNSNVIGILDGLQRKFIKLDLSGNLIKDYPISDFVGVNKFTFLENSDIVFSKGLAPGPIDQRYSLIITDSELKFKNKLFHYTNFSSAVISALFPFQSEGNGTLYLPIYSDKIYQITSNSIKQKYKLSFGKKWMPNDYVYSRLHTTSYQWLFSELPKSEYVYFVNFAENKGNVIVYFTYKGRNYLTVYDKLSKKILTTLLTDDYTSLGISNENSYTISDKYFAGNIKDMNILEYNDSQVRKHVPALKQSATQINPIITLITFKKL